MSVLPPPVTNKPLVPPPPKRRAILTVEPNAQQSTVQLFTDFAQARETLRISPNCAFPIELGSAITPVLHIPAADNSVIFWNKNQLVITLEIIDNATDKPIKNGAPISVVPTNHVIPSLFSQISVHMQSVGLRTYVNYGQLYHIFTYFLNRSPSKPNLMENYFYTGDYYEFSPDEHWETKKQIVPPPPSLVDGPQQYASSMDASGGGGNDGGTSGTGAKRRKRAAASPIDVEEALRLEAAAEMRASTLDVGDDPQPPAPPKPTPKTDPPPDQGAYRRYTSGNVWLAKFEAGAHSTATFTTSLYLPCFAIAEQFLPRTHSIEIAFSLNAEKVFSMNPSWQPEMGKDLSQRIRIREMYMDVPILQINPSRLNIYRSVISKGLSLKSSDYYIAYWNWVKGTKNFHTGNFYMPPSRHVLIFFIKSEAMRGAWNMSPYNYQYPGLKNLEFRYSTKVWNFDYGVRSKRHMDAYIALEQSLRLSTTPFSLINWDIFLRGGAYVFSIDTTITLTAMTQIMEPTGGAKLLDCNVTGMFVDKKAQENDGDGEGLDADYTMWVVGMQDCFLNITDTRAELNQYAYDHMPAAAG